MMTWHNIVTYLPRILVHYGTHGMDVDPLNCRLGQDIFSSIEHLSNPCSDSNCSLPHNSSPIKQEDRFKSYFRPCRAQKTAPKL